MVPETLAFEPILLVTSLNRSTEAASAGARPCLVIPTTIKAGYSLLLQNIHLSSMTHLSISYILYGASLVAQMVKNLPATQETWV